MSQTVTKLNNLLANMHVLVTKLHNYHWNVSGLHFGAVHAKTESYYDYFFAQFDEVAERILQLKAKPLATNKAYLEAATIQEESANSFTTQEVLEKVLGDFEAILAQVKDLQNAAEDDDTPTNDMLDDQRAWLEKEIWMLNATLSR